VFVDADNRIVHRGSVLDTAGGSDAAEGAPECCLP
jgi:hypothetical protein